MARQKTTKASSTARGYDYAHQKLRAQWDKQVQAGQAYCQQGLHGSSGRCHHTSRWIKPGTPWALGHTDDRTGYIGPCHADCNQLDGASRGGHTIAARRHARRHSDTTWQPINW